MKKNLIQSLILMVLLALPMNMAAQDENLFLFLFAGVEQKDPAMTDIFMRAMSLNLPARNRIQVKNVAKGEEAQLLSWAVRTEREGVVRGIVMNGDLYSADEVVSFHQKALSTLGKPGRELPILMLKTGEQERDQLNERIQDGFTVWIKGDNNEIDGGKLARKMVQVMGNELVNHGSIMTENVTGLIDSKSFNVTAAIDAHEVMTATADTKLQKVEIVNGTGAVIKTIELDGTTDQVVINTKEFGNEENLKFKFYSIDGAVNDGIEITY